MSNNMEDIAKSVIEILADKLNISLEKIKPESKLVEDLGMDSFGAIEVMFEVEEKFKIEISDESLQGLKTVSDICNFISATAKEKS